MAPRTKRTKQVKRKAPGAKASEPATPPSVKTVAYDEDGVNTLFEAMSVVAVRCDDDEHGERFWIAQLLDDTIEDMLDDASAHVNVLYFDKVVADNMYHVGNYDAIPVQAIMCEIQLDEPSPGEFKLPKRHLERVRDAFCLMLQPLKKRRTAFAAAEATTKPTSTPTATAAAIKTDKWSGLPKRIVQVRDAENFTDDAMTGNHAFRSKCSDVVSSAKELIRAVLVGDHHLLESVVQKPALHRHMHTFFVTRSAGVPKTALHYAIERADLKAISALVAAAKVDKAKFAKKPVCALVTLDTGKHTSSFSDYNRCARTVCNNALLKDETGSVAPLITTRGIDSNLERFLWENPTTTYEMIMLIYPGDSWVQHSATHIPCLARSGNYVLLSKLVAILVARGGWGYNNLHSQVLGSPPLEPFKKVSVLKKGSQHAIRPLHFAAINPNPAHLETLMAELDQAGLGQVDAGNWATIHYAAACQGSEPLKRLLQAGVDVSLRTKSKDTPLTVAARLGRLDNVKLLLEHSATDVAVAVESAAWLGFRPLHYAAQNGHDQVVMFLLAKGANANAGTSGKESPLALAAEAGHLNCVQALLQHKGIAVDVFNKVRRTPLMVAVMNGHVQVAVALLNAGANANAVDTSLNSVMHYAAGYGWLSCVKLLVAVDAAAWFRNAWGYSPMAVAALKGRYDVSRYLVAIAPAHEHAIDFRDANGATMLFLQCKLAETIDEIEFLLANGASPNVPTSAFEFPLQQVLQRLPNDELDSFLVSIANLLIKHKAHITHDDMRHVGQPLALAMAKKHRRFFDQFLPHSDLTALGPNGQNLWMEAVHHDPEYLTAMVETATAFPIVQDMNGNNWFHYLVDVAATAHSIETIQAIVKKLTKAEMAAAMSDVNVDGFTPLMALVQHERPTKAGVDYVAVDRRYCALLRLYLQHSVNVESVVTVGKVDPCDRAKRLASSNETVLHLAAARRLSPSTGWKGDDVLHIVLECGPKWTKSTVNVVSVSKKSALLLASENGHALGVQALLKMHADPNFYLSDKANNIEGVTPLFAAVSNGHTEIARLLLEHGANPSFTEGEGLQTPLHVALQRNDAAITEVLLTHGAGVCALNQAGLSALSSAILQGFSVTKADLHENEVHFGLAYNTRAKDGWDFLCVEDRVSKAKVVDGSAKQQGNEASHASKSPRKATGKRVNDDDNGPDKENASTTSTAQADMVETPETASRLRKRSAISVLLQHSSSAPAIGLGDTRGRTPLHFACANRDVHLLRALLLLSKAAINAPDHLKRTPLHFAVNAAVMTPDATFDVESVLLLHGANVNAVDSFGFSALHFALQKVNLDWHTDNPTKSADDFKRYMEIVPAPTTDPIETVGNLTLVDGIQVDGQDLLGRSCLHLGAATGAVVSTLRMLQMAPPSLLEVVNHRGDTALGIAMKYGRKEVVTNLIQHGANIHVQFTQDRSRFGLYCYAVERKWQGVCHMLLNAGYCRRQAVEDSIRSHGFQLTQNLITGLLNTKDRTLTQTNADGQTLLHVLAQQAVEFEGIVRTIAWQLVDAGVSVSESTARGETALHFAAVHGNLNLMRFLLHLDAKLAHQLTHANESPLVYAFKNVKTPTKHASPDFSTVVRSLVFLGRVGANVDQADADGQTVLTLLLDRFFARPTTDSSQLELLDLVDYLLTTCRVSPNGRYTTGLPIVCSPQTTDVVTSVTPLIRAVHIPSVYLREHTLAMLLHHGAKIQDTDSQGNTVLMHAIVRNHLDDLRICLGGVSHAERATATLQDDASGARVTKVWTIHVSSSDKTSALNVSNAFGETALHLAVQPRAHGSFENVAIVDLLLQENVKVNALDKRQKSALDLAKEQPSGVLLQRLTNTSAPPIRSATPITFADVPPVDHDATVYLNQCQAQGLVQTVPIPLAKSSICQAGPKASVHVDGAIEYSVVLTKVDVQSGQHGVNVFYRMQVVHNEVQNVYVLFTNWGRVGESGKYQHTPFSDAASAVDEFKKIFKSKTGNVFDRVAVHVDNGGDAFEKKNGKYMLNPRRLERHVYDAKVTEPFHGQASAVASALDAGVQQVLGVVTDIRCLEEAASAYNHSLDDIPLVELQPSLLVTALDRLNEIKTSLHENAAVLKKMKSTDAPLEPTAIAALADTWRAASEAVAEKSSRYYELVPRSDASSDTALAAFMSEDDVNKEITRVRQLLEIAETSKIILGAKSVATNRHPLDYCYDALQVHLAPSSTAEFDMISRYFERGIHSKTKAYKVSRAFKVHRKGEAERMESLTVPGHHTLLWHGTKKTNLMGILSRGLRIAPPEAPVTGYAFGKGIYFADASEKSLKYCGGNPYTLSDKRKVHYMLLCDVALGNLHKVVESEYREAAADGTHSTFAMAKYQPNPAGTLVTSMGAYQIPLGKLQQVGVEMSYPSAWAIGNSPDVSDKPGNTSWKFQANQLERDGQALLDKALATGQTKIAWEKSSEVSLRPLHIFGLRWEVPQKAVVEIERKEFHVNGRDRAVHCKVTIELGNKSTYSYSAHKYFDVLATEALPTGFTFQPATPALTHNEYIVYNEAQVQIVYLVEVEVVDR
ncbi:hypothetical protein DYB32_006862 [Aphanomyces invadans]|uniref:Poly [ADP-ribose] polymerase n=1 Tax=Aphanomyces invadans TaxID=157072 RepID=A0A418AQQ4_9STRA|nr:hypothetical protein DYB32_006862 [Aphanomyces invadans]